MIVEITLDMSQSLQEPQRLDDYVPHTAASRKRALRALIVDDTPSDAAIVIRSLERAGYAVEWQRVDTTSEMRDALVRQIWDVVISDHLMPHMDAPTALSVLRDTELDIPFVVVSGTVDADIAVELMRLGAHDYLLKNDLGRLAPTIAREMAQASSRLHQREAQAQADIALARYTELYDQAPIGYFTLGRGGAVLQVNRMAARIMGVGQDQILDAAFDSYVTGADRAMFRDFLATAFASQVLNTCEVRLTAGASKMHRIVRIESSGSADGLQCRAVMTDITALANTQRQIHHAKKQWEASVDAVPELIVITNVNRTVVRCNKAAMDYFGGGYQDLIGRPIGDVFGDPQLAMLRPTGAEAAGYPLVRDDRVLSARCFDVSSEGGNGYVFLLQDVTRRQQMDAEIKALNRDLVQRTAALEAINANLSTFCYSVSHDLRAPLRRMDAWSTAVLEDYGSTMDARGQQYLGEIRAESQRMSQLIESMMTLSRVAHADMQCQSVDLSDMAQAIVERLRVNAPASPAQVVVQPGMVVEGDPVLLGAALTNLLDNAWKFSSRQSAPQIEVGCDDADGQRVFFVRDNGAGFDPAYADKLFTPFQRLHKDSEFPGTGIGLATVQRIMARHGGRIWAESELGQGTTMSFQLGTPNP